jgi:hypothetical protein
MKGSWKHGGDGVERELRAGKPEPTDEFVARVSGQIPARRREWSRLSFAGALTVLMLGTFVSFGGLSYAAASAQHTAVAVKHVVVKSKRTYVVHVHSAAGDQYDSVKTVTKVVKTVKTVKVKPHVAGAVASVKPAVKSATLPFTGVSLLSTVMLGLALVGLGFLLRRREARE